MEHEIGSAGAVQGSSAHSYKYRDLRRRFRLLAGRNPLLLVCVLLHVRRPVLLLVVWYDGGWMEPGRHGMHAPTTPSETRRRWARGGPVGRDLRVRSWSIAGAVKITVTGCWLFDISTNLIVEDGVCGRSSLLTM